MVTGIWLHQNYLPALQCIIISQIITFDCYKMQTDVQLEVFLILYGYTPKLDCFSRQYSKQ